MRFLEFEVDTVVGVKYVPDLNFPAVTICNFNQFLRSKVPPQELELVNAIYGIEGTFRTCRKCRNTHKEGRKEGSKEGRKEGRKDGKVEWMD